MKNVPTGSWDGFDAFSKDVDKACRALVKTLKERHPSMSTVRISTVLVAALMQLAEEGLLEEDKQRQNSAKTTISTLKPHHNH